MKKFFKTAICRYEKPVESARKVIGLSGGWDNIKAGDSVFIKPNIVFWTKAVPFPKWGAITTSRMVQDVVLMLKERGVDQITIGEGIVTLSPKDLETPNHAFMTLGYRELEQRYGIKAVNVMERPFEKVDLGEDVSLKFNADILHSDYVIDIPVLKSHNQTVVSLGIKNLKGTIDIPSRKKCHSSDPEHDLNFYISKLADKMPPIYTLIDGIYSLERGPGFDGRMKRSNILVGSWDILSADLVGARLLGHDPAHVPHLVHAAANRGRPLDLSDVEVVGESIENLAAYHEFDFPYSKNEDGVMPTPLAAQGIKGLFYQKYDLSMCTYCSALNGVVLSAIRFAWKGEPWDRVEILTGKQMKPTPGMKKTILFGKCMYKAHKDHPDIQEMIAVKGCPPNLDEMASALHQAGIMVDPGLFKQVDQLPGFFMARYQNRPEFDESFFKIEPAS